MDKEEYICFECGSHYVNKIEKEYKFPYAINLTNHSFSIRIPVYKCDSCGFGWWDDEASEIIDEFIKNKKEEMKNEQRK